MIDGEAAEPKVEEHGSSPQDRAAIVAEMQELFAPLREGGYTVEQFLADKREEAEAEER